jgi:hypothetical protein
MALPETGPYLAAAVLCEKVIQEADGVVSLMRVIDRVTVNVTVTPQGSGVPAITPPSSMPPVLVSSLTLFLSFKAGLAQGRSNITIRLVGPDEQRVLEQQATIHFSGGADQGANLIIALNLQLHMEGLYWFYILLENEFLTRVPLRLVYNPQGLTI